MLWLDVHTEKVGNISLFPHPHKEHKIYGTCRIKLDLKIAEVLKIFRNDETTSYICIRNCRTFEE